MGSFSVGFKSVAIYKYQRRSHLFSAGVLQVVNCLVHPLDRGVEDVDAVNLLCIYGGNAPGYSFTLYDITQFFPLIGV